MEKKFLFFLILGAFAFSALACTSKENLRASYFSVAANAEKSITTTQEETFSPEPATAFSFSFDALKSSLSDCGLIMSELEPLETDQHYIQGIRIGRTSDPVSTWVYSFADKVSHSIVGIKISCGDISNVEKSEEFFNSVNAFLNISGINISEPQKLINSSVQLDNITFTINSEDREYCEWIDMFAYFDGNIFSDNLLQKPLKNYGTLKFPSNIPVVNWNDVTSHAYDNQYVYIDGVVDNYDAGFNGVNFNMYFQHDGIYDVIRFYPSKEQCDDLIGFKNGDVLRISQYIADEGAVGQGFITADKIGEISIDEVHAGYKNGCPVMDYESIARTPIGQSEQDIKCKFTGNIAQVIDEGNEFSTPTYLVESNGNYVYVEYYRSFENRNTRFLEGDNVTVYGNFTIMKTYDTLMGEKTVPQINTYLIELI